MAAEQGGPGDFVKMLLDLLHRGVADLDSTLKKFNRLRSQMITPSGVLCVRLPRYHQAVIMRCVEAEADEMCSFVRKKANNQWLQQGRVG